MKLAILITLLLVSFSSQADESCFYPSKIDGGDLSRFDDCGSIEGDSIKLGKEHNDNIVFNEKGLACLILSNNEVFYIHKNGNSQRSFYFENGCDYFKDGLSRGIINGNMVFIDEQLEVALNPGFELIAHYDYGHSVVCNGPFSEEKQGEYTFRRGGKCGLIDRQGKLVVEAVHKIEERKAFRDYINSNNHCPAPPISSEKSALCHAKRHVSNMEYHTDQWKRYEISKRGEIWLITFVEEGNQKEEFTLTLNADSAHWKSIIKESHSSALQQLNQ
jgi:hypothetical protein